MTAITASGPLGKSGFFAGMIAALRNARARRTFYVGTRDGLSALSDRELADIGVTRWDIPRMARETCGMAEDR